MFVAFVSPSFQATFVSFDDCRAQPLLLIRSPLRDVLLEKVLHLGPFFRSLPGFDPSVFLCSRKMYVHHRTCPPVFFAPSVTPWPKSLLLLFSPCEAGSPSHHHFTVFLFPLPCRFLVFFPFFSAAPFCNSFPFPILARRCWLPGFVTPHLSSCLFFLAHFLTFPHF